MKRLFITLSLLVLTLSACETSARQSSPAPYPLTEPSFPPIIVIPTPSAPNKATVTGILLVKGNPPRPVVGALLYLADIIPEARGTPWLAGFERQFSPRTQTDNAGRFVFLDVPAGKYSLVLDRVSQAFLLRNPQDESDLLFEPEPGQVLDLGNLVYPSLPGQSPYP